MSTTEEFARAAEIARATQFVAANAPKQCRRCSDPFALVDKNGICANCAEKRAASMAGYDAPFTNRVDNSASPAEQNRQRRALLAERNARLVITDDDRRLGTNGARQAEKMDLARLDRLHSARTNLSGLLTKLGKFEVQITLYPNNTTAWQAYDGFYARLHECAATIAQLSGEEVHIPSRIERPAPRPTVAVSPGLKPDAEPREFKAGPAPVSVAPGTLDGLQTPGLGGENAAKRKAEFDAMQAELRK